MGNRPQFPPQQSKPMTPKSYETAVRRGQKLLELVERHRPNLPGKEFGQRDKQQLTRAINGVAAWARDLSRRHRGLSVGQELDETAASLGRLGGQAGTGEAKRRGKDDPDYYSQLAKARWKKPAPDKPTP